MGDGEERTQAQGREQLGLPMGRGDVAVRGACRREDRRSGVKLTKVLASGQARVRQHPAIGQPARARMRLLRTRVAIVRIGRHGMNAAGVDLDIGKTDEGAEPEQDRGRSSYVGAGAPRICAWSSVCCGCPRARSGQLRRERDLADHR